MTITPSIDQHDFRLVCSLFTTGVAVATTSLDGVKLGLTINSFASVSLDPPLVLWSLRASSRCRPVFEAAGSFAINILSAEQLPLAQQFAGDADGAFREKILPPSRLGLPLIADALAHLECKTRHIYDAGDHRIFIGEVVDLRAREGVPLVFFRGNFSTGLPGLELGKDRP